MAKYKGQDGTEELDTYLTEEFNLVIYEDLTKGDNAGVFEPLEFFKLLFTQIIFVEDNKGKPFTVVKNIRNLELTDKQKYVLLLHLDYLIQVNSGFLPAQLQGFYTLFAGIKVNNLIVPPKDAQLGICRALIASERDRIAENIEVAEETEKQPAKENKFDFEGKVKPYLETLPDDTARLKYLYEVKAEYEQTFSRDLDWSFGEPNFAEKCEIEIQKIKDRMALERKPEAEAREESKQGVGTTAQQVLAIYYLLKYCKAEQAKPASKARLIRFLTGKNLDDIKDKLRDAEGETLQFNRNGEDVSYVRDLFQQLGITEIIRMIDNDTGTSEQK